MTVCSNFIYKGGKIEKKSQSAKYPHGEKSRLYRKSQVKKSAYIESVGVPFQMIYMEEFMYLIKKIINSFL